MRNRKAVGVLGALLVGATTVMAFAAPANAAPPSPPKPPGVPAPFGVTTAGLDDVGTLDCSHAHPDRDRRAYGPLFDASAVRIRRGPHVACTADGQGQRNHRVDYHCFDTGDSVTANGVTLNTWTYLRDVTTGVQGWVSDTLLDRNPNGSRGSTVPCSL